MKILFSIFLAVVLYSCQIDTKVGTENGPENTEKNEVSSTEPFQVTLDLTSENTLLWNEIPMDTSVLKDSIIRLINKSMDSGQSQIELDSIGIVDQTNYLITFYKAKSTSDEFYESIVNIIDMSIDKVRDEKSLLIYKSPFIELSEDQQLNMNRVVQTRVIESTTPK
jgi:hypothetical protein